MKFSTAAMLQLMIGYAFKKAMADDDPMHYFNTGFRNYPIAPEPAARGASFLFCVSNAKNVCKNVPNTYPYPTC